MEELNAKKIKKLKLGEAIGTVATAFCGGITVAFIICFAIAQVKDIDTLRMISLILLPSLLAVAIGVSAYCNLTFGRRLNEIIKNRVQTALIENAPLMHPDKNALVFGISIGRTEAEIKVNNYKEKITIDFSAFKKLSISKKSAVSEAVAERLNITFCRLYDRGTHYNSVSYFRADAGKKRGKEIFIISEGQPDKRAYRTYGKAK